MPSAPPTDRHAIPACSALRLLNLVLQQLPQPVVLLRPLTDHFDPRRDDVDLLLTGNQRRQVLAAALNIVETGLAHARITSSNSDKTQLRLWSPDLHDSITVDLWTAWTQLPTADSRRVSGRQPAGDRQRIPAEWIVENAGDSRQTSADLVSAVELPAAIHWSLLVLHAAAKQRRLDTPIMQARIADAERRVEQAPDRNEVLSFCEQRRQLPDLNQIPDWESEPARSLIRFAGSTLREWISRPNLGERRPLPRPRSLTGSIRRWWLRTFGVRALVGSDGSGKTTLCGLLAQRSATGMQTVTTRRLYRRTLTWVLIGGLLRRLNRWTREELENRCAWWTALRAGQATFWRSLWRRKGLLLDRSPASLLISHRRTDTPRPPQAWLESLLPPVHSVLLVVPLEELQRRKQEMTPQGHVRYQRMLFEQALRQSPCELTLLAAGTDSSPVVLSRRLEQLLESNAARVAMPRSADDASHQARAGQLRSAGVAG